MKKIYRVLFLILFLIVSAPIFAQDKTVGTINQVDSETGQDKVSFKIENELDLNSGLVIPQDSMITVQIIDIQDARRWHKSAFLISKLINYKKLANNELVNMENEDIYFLIKKYEPLDKKEMGKTAVEIGATTAASFVVPGADIAYYFTKGMMHKQEGKTRFKSGVSSVYENSIFWVWFRGKSLDLDENASIQLTQISEEKAMKLKSDVEKRKERKAKIEAKKEALEEEFLDY